MFINKRKHASKIHATLRILFFRQKLQQARTEYQREVNYLKKTIATLQQQVAFYEQPVPQPQQPRRHQTAGRQARFTNRWARGGGKDVVFKVFLLLHYGS